MGAEAEMREEEEPEACGRRRDACGRGRDVGEGEDVGEAVMWRGGPLNGPSSLSPYSMTTGLLFFLFF